LARQELTSRQRREIEEFRDRLSGYDVADSTPGQVAVFSAPARRRDHRRLTQSRRFDVAQCGVEVLAHSALGLLWVFPGDGRGDRAM
jgi:hypothetical protein